MPNDNASPIDPTRDHVLRTYLHAKDLSRLHLLAEAFTEDAVFTSRLNFAERWMDDQTAAGLAQITETFRGLGRGFENIYTVYTPESVETQGDELICRWLVGMSARDGGEVHVAWGDYRWRFAQDRATRLDVVMEGAATLSPGRLREVMSWLRALPSIWCPGARLLSGAPQDPSLELMRAYFEADAR